MDMPPTRPRSAEQAVERLWDDMYGEGGAVPVLRQTVAGVHRRLDRLQTTLVSGLVVLLGAGIGGVLVLLAHL
jgi:hypothetical protein